jgi:transposase
MGIDKVKCLMLVWGTTILLFIIKKCILENLAHRPEFLSLRQMIDKLTAGFGVQTHIVFENTGVYSRSLARFM